MHRRQLLTAARAIGLSTFLFTPAVFAALKPNRLRESTRQHTVENCATDSNLGLLISASD